MHSEQVKAVHRAEVAELFERLGLREAFENSELQCRICRDVITSENFRAVTLLAGELVFYCTKWECPMSIVENLQDQRDEDD